MSTGWTFPFRIPYPKEIVCQTDEAAIVDVFPEYVQQNGMIYPVKTRAYVSLDKPLHPPPMASDLLQGRMTPAPWPEPV